MALANPTHTACHNQPATQMPTQTTTSSIPQDNSINRLTQQINNINSTYRIHNNPTFERTNYTEIHRTTCTAQTPRKKNTVGTCTRSAPLKKRVIFTLSAPIRTPLNI